MPSYLVDSTSPAQNRFTRTPKVKIAATVATTGIATVAANALDGFQNGDLCRLVDAVAGTALTGGTGGSNVARDDVLSIGKLSSTTAQLYLNNSPITLGVAVSAGGALQFGDLPTSLGIASKNIVASGSVAGGAFGGPLD